MVPDANSDEAPAGLGAQLLIGGLALVVASLLLIVLELVVRWLSEVIGAPLPYVHDDADSIEWGGLAELVGYGLAGAVALYGFHKLSVRWLPGVAHRLLHRTIGFAALVAAAVGGAWAAIVQGDDRAAGIALACGFAATRVVRGRPFDEDEPGSEDPSVGQ